MGQILDAVAPLGGDGNFPYPRLIQTGEPGLEYVTYEGPIINGQPMPGQWLLKRSERVFGWQKQSAAFQNGATVVPTGDPPMDIEYEVRLWESGAWRIYQGLCSRTSREASTGDGSSRPALRIAPRWPAGQRRARGTSRKGPATAPCRRPPASLVRVSIPPDAASILRR